MSSPSVPDVVYVVGKSGTNEELRYSLRSLRNIPHGTVWLAGYRPKWVRNVEHLPLRQEKTRYQNSTANLLAACHHPDVADDVIYMNDDFFFLEPIERMPVYHWGKIEEALGYYNGKYGRPSPGQRSGNYRRGMAQTADLLRRWGFDELLCYEVHVPMPIHKGRMAEAIRRAARDAPSIVALHKRTLYGNLYRIGGEMLGTDRRPDVKVLTSDHTWDAGQLFVSTSNQSFNSGRVGRRLRKRFSEPSPYERSR
ncbi:MAG: hypothetical protein ACLFWM_08690 [Actinomycetota bacterium]